MEKTKRCSCAKCPKKNPQPITAFYANSSRCKTCCSASGKQYRERRGTFPRTSDLKICRSGSCHFGTKRQPAKNFNSDCHSTDGLRNKCRECESEERAKRRSQDVKLFLRMKFKDAERRARRLKHRFAILFDDWLQVYKDQAGLCALTGKMMTRITGRTQLSTKKLQRGSRHKYPFNISPDQREPAKGYTKENLQFVCNHVNAMKWELSVSDFRQWCSDVFKYRS